jgi:hypothetical protein
VALAIPIVIALVLLSASSVPVRELAASGPGEIIAQTIRNEVGRELREAGARYDDLHVKVAAHRQDGTPFLVTYRGLRDFKGGDGTVPKAAGSFAMQYIGAGQWQGELAGIQFTVSVGSRDNIELPFVDDPPVLGTWESVDFVATIAEFNPDLRAMRGELFFKGLTFLAGGKTTHPWFTWTKGVLIHHGDQTASRYELRELKGRTYLFLEWKSGDFTISGRKPQYYVLQSIHQ